MLFYPSLLSDLDGTIIDSKKVMDNAFEELCDKHLTKENKKIAKKILYKSPKEALQLIGINDLTDYWLAYEHHIDKATMFNNIDEILDILVKDGLKVGIVTSLPASRASLLIESVGIRHLISFIIGWEFTVPRKPNPHSVLKAINHIKKKQRILYIGDSQDDIIAGKKAGVDTGFVTWGYFAKKEISETPNFIISTPFSLKEIIMYGREN